MDTLDQILENLWSSDYVQTNPKKSYKSQYNAEYTAIAKYMSDGTRPNPTNYSKMGKVLVGLEDQVRAVMPPDPPPPTGELGVDRTTMLATGGSILRNDDAAQADPLTGLWGQLAAASASRCVHKTSGGDPRPRADGTTNNASYREMSVQDGDAWQGESAERCELGRNTTTPYYTECQPGSVDGTFALSDEGEHKIHFFSQRYHDNMVLTQDNWQVVFQNKQDQPYAANGPVDTAPALAITIYGGLIHLENFWSIIWTTPAPPKNVWIRYALEAFYSKDASKGWVRLYVDNDGDGDFLDADEMSPQITCPTLATITSKGNSPRNVGDPLPSHMRIGIYRQGSTYTGTGTMDIDNIQVVG